MNRKKLLKSNRKGSIVGLTLIVLMVLLVMGVGMLSLGLRGRILALRSASEIAARCAADAGLTKALFEMNEKLKAKPWSDSSLPQAADEALPNCDAIFSYTTTGDSSNGFTIESIGSYGWAQKEVNSTLRLKSIFEYAIFAQGAIWLRQGTTVSRYNFGAGDEPLVVGTNSTTTGAVTMLSGVTVEGDVVVGAGGNPATVINSKKEANITGQTYAGAEMCTLPSITVPAALQALPSGGILSGPNTLTGPAKYDSINLGAGSKITINGPVSLYITGSINIGNTAQMVIVDANTNPNASLTMYVGGNLTTQNGAAINNLTKKPKKLQMYGLDSCTKINLMNAGVLYGVVYAPNADVHLYNSFEIYGSVVSKSFVQDVSSNFHYDGSLRNASVNDEFVRFVVKRWREE